MEYIKEIEKFCKDSFSKEKSVIIPIYLEFEFNKNQINDVWRFIEKKYSYSFFFSKKFDLSSKDKNTYMGYNPSKIITREKNKNYIIEDGKKNQSNESIDDLINLELNKKKFVVPNFPNFTGGFVAFFGYESISLNEKIPIYPMKKGDFPEVVLMLYETIFVFNEQKNSLRIFDNIQIDPGHTLKNRIEDSKKIIKNAYSALLKMSITPNNKIFKPRPSHSNHTKLEFCKKVNKAKEYIKQGEVFQIVLSQKFERKTQVIPSEVLFALKEINPSPYLFHYKFANFNIIGSSPELLIKSINGKIKVKPIAGTRKMSSKQDENKKIAEELLKDEKEMAEHLMLIDLGRNDVGKVSKIGSVNLIKKMEIEFYSHVMHIVSEVEGEKNNDLDFFDIFFSGFPAGTVTGAPKIRAMELINELEPCRRGFYSGGIGLIDYSKDFDSCIAIRSMQIYKEKATFQAGAGIVFDSIPENEYQECINKLIVLERALTIAEQGKKSP
ncbi:MAG: anthranilate synthase component I [bacterium TMED144]|nr:MAG: anthranilate synthase component I [bacterium TMED144]|tara:strand:+ start:179 stop:1666 length:1488 start_codon:yes stop_codon:yes gene_type:complete